MSRRGTSLIDLLISMAIIAVLFGGIYLVYFSLITAIANISVRTAATSAIQAEIETVRNLPYAEVGTVGGVPAGIIPATQAVAVGNYSFALTTTVRNIDDPFDGTLGGSPPDAAPLDYKLVAIQATCPLCTNFVSVEVTTTVAPKGLESAPPGGALLMTALDANGMPVGGASMHIVNASVTPSIDFTDTTNASGVLELVGFPTSTQGYQITATKAGYSTDQTYPPGALANPNPLKPNATVVDQFVTAVSFAIDRLSSLAVYSSDNRCTPTGNVPFDMRGEKLIGTNPNVVKFSTTSATNAGGSVTFPALEWDTYMFSLSGAADDLMGTVPQSPLAVDPNTSSTLRLVVMPASDPSLLVTTVDAGTGAGIPNAAVTLARAGFSQTLTTGHALVTRTDWSGGQYSSQSGGIDANSSPGRLTLLVNASGTYDVNTNDWLISNTIDLGGQNATLYGVSWDPAPQPAGASVAFQLAANNNNATWNFIGPGGTAATYFTTTTKPLPAALSGKRYVRYKVYMNTIDGNVTPGLDDVTIEFNADCVPPVQALFTDLAQAAYTIDVSAANYGEATTSITIGPGATSTVISLNHQ